MNCIKKLILSFIIGSTPFLAWCEQEGEYNTQYEPPATSIRESVFNFMNLEICPTGYIRIVANNSKICESPKVILATHGDLQQLEQKMHSQFQQQESDRQDDILEKLVERIKKDPKFAQELLKASQKK